MCQSFFKKFLIQTTHDLSSHSSDYLLPNHLISCLRDIERTTSNSAQEYEVSDQDTMIGKPEAHVSGLKHVTGEAVYVDDMPKVANELYAALVGSTEAHAKIL